MTVSITYKTSELIVLICVNFALPTTYRGGTSAEDKFPDFIYTNLTQSVCSVKRLLDKSAAGVRVTSASGNYVNCSAIETCPIGPKTICTKDCADFFISAVSGENFEILRQIIWREYEECGVDLEERTYSKNRNKRVCLSMVFKNKICRIASVNLKVYESLSPHQTANSHTGNSTKRATRKRQRQRKRQLVRPQIKVIREECEILPRWNFQYPSVASFEFINMSFPENEMAMYLYVKKEFIVFHYHANFTFIPTVPARGVHVCPLDWNDTYRLWLGIEQCKCQKVKRKKSESQKKATQ